MTIQILIVSSVAVLSLGCGPSSPATGAAPGDDAGAAADAPQIPASGPIPRALGPSAVAQAICAKVAQCGCDWATSAPCQNDGACSASTCVDTFTTAYQSADMGATQAGRVYDPQGARKCTDAVAAAACVDVDYVNLCTVLWNGTQTIGQPCGATQACQTSDAVPAMCGAGGACVAGAIGSTPPTGVPLGGACNGTCSGTACSLTFGGSGGQCQHAAGLACVAGTCQPLRNQGDACTGEFACSDPLTCRGGVCATPLANGSACIPPSGDNPCSVGSGCVAGACATLKPNGQPCQVPAECLENRCYKAQCIAEFAQPLCGG
jgi:hypothetical protein